MGKEIERKFLVRGDSWKSHAKGTITRQGYLNRAAERTVRVRTMDGKGFLTIKGPSAGATRAEYEYEIPLADANAMLDSLVKKPIIEKNRFKIERAGLVWEVDEFLGENAGLVMAEVELENEDQVFDKPEWAGQEVTDDPRYYNANLVEHPYSQW